MKHSLLCGILRFLPLAIFASAADAGLLWGIRSFMQILSGDFTFSLGEWVLIMVMLTVLRQVFTFTKTRSSETFLYNTGTDITHWYIDTLRKLSPRLFHTARGNTQVEAAYDATQILISNGGVFYQAIQALLQLVIFLPVLFYISWPLTLFLFLVIVPLVAVLQRKLHAMGKEEESLLYGKSSFRTNLNKARRIFRNWSSTFEVNEIEKELKSDIDRLNQESLAESTHKNRLATMTESVSVLAMIFVLSFCSLLISKGWMEIEGLVLFCSAVLLCYKPVKECSRVLPQFRSVLSAFNILKAFKDLPQRQRSESRDSRQNSLESRAERYLSRQGESARIEQTQHLDIHRKFFHYENSTEPVFKDFNLALDMEKPVLLRGRNGIGKSTLLRLIAGLEEWETPSTDKAVGGSYGDLSPRVFFIPQDLELPPRKILISLINKITDKKHNEVLESFIKTANINHLIQKEGLSGGERSRIALTWALASDASILLLDEPLAAIALADRERILQAFLDAVQAMHRHAIIASHDPFSPAIENQLNIVELEHAKLQ